MKVAHLDCSSGVSGDMWLGALIDAGASLEAVQDAVDTLGVGDVRITMGRVRRGGVPAVSVRVRPPQELPSVARWEQIENLLQYAALAEPVRDRALATFQRLVTAQATIQRADPEDLELNEVGALDTIADVVGTCAATVSLGLQRLTCGPVAIGSGQAAGAHGRTLVPAPAVIELLGGYPVVEGVADTELTTPTGAALLAELATPVDAMPRLRLERVGMGAGARDLAGHPNVLRVLVGETAPEAAHARDDARQSELVVLEATVDDLNPELVPLVLDRLRDAGANDTWATPVLMKKGRPGYTLSALCEPAALETLRDVLYRESSTLGARWYTVGREALPREWLDVEVHGRTVRVKVARHRGAVVTVAPELADVEATAQASGLPARAVFAAAERAAWQQVRA